MNVAPLGSLERWIPHDSEADSDTGEADNSVEFLLEYAGAGRNRIGTIKSKKAANLSDVENFQAISNFVIEITGEVCAELCTIEGAGLSGYVCEVIYHNGNR